jgi:hypothetical protein
MVGMTEPVADLPLVTTGMVLAVEVDWLSYRTQQRISRSGAIAAAA